MKLCILVLIACLTISCVSTPVIPLRDEIVALDTFLGNYVISGFAVGVGPDPGTFYLLSKRIAEEGNQEQFKLMLKDPSPAVRVMGLVCLSKHYYDFDVLQGDTAIITALPVGCGGIKMTVEEFSVRLKKDETFRACFCENEEDAWRLLSQKDAEAEAEGAGASTVIEGNPTTNPPPRGAEGGGGSEESNP